MRSTRNINCYTDQYMETPFLKENNWYRQKCVMEQLEKYKPYRILEIGCGIYPIFLQNIEGLGGVEDWLIIEPSSVFANNAMNKAKEAGLGGKVHIIQNYFEGVNLVDERDFIICSSLLHEVENPQRLLKSIYNCCGNSTVVHINVPNAKSLHRLIAQLGGIIEDVHNLSERNHLLQQRQVYDMELLIAEVGRGGFEIIDKGSFFIKPFTHKQMARMMDEGIIDQSVLDGLYGLTKYLPEFGGEIFVNVKRVG